MKQEFFCICKSGSIPILDPTGTKPRSFLFKETTGSFDGARTHDWQLIYLGQIPGLVRVTASRSIKSTISELNLSSFQYNDIFLSVFLCLSWLIHECLLLCGLGFGHKLLL